ncbi:MAG: hypothetical protein H6608_03365 [Flavobacteriales bacterium]|nr:hypothetical protein [Bacteroidota bacterium]MCB9240144.1 hypothetical protein [Flavobacteriales bacterium]
MKKTIIASTLLLFVTVFTLSQCSDPKPEPGISAELNETENDTVIINPPCHPDTNTVLYNGSKLSHYYTNFGEKGVLYHNYEIRGNGSQSDLRIGFKYVPETGKYITTTNPVTFDVKKNECTVSGTFGGTFSFHYMAAARDTVYVQKIGEGKYIADFCGLEFSSSQTTFTFSSDANLTVD